MHIVEPQLQALSQLLEEGPEHLRLGFGGTDQGSQLSTSVWASQDHAQAMLMGSVVAVITATLLLINVLDHPVQAGFGGLKPAAMERTVQILDQERKFTGDHGALPCDANGTAL